MRQELSKLSPEFVKNCPKVTGRNLFTDSLTGCLVIDLGRRRRFRQLQRIRRASQGQKMVETT